MDYLFPVFSIDPFAREDSILDEISADLPAFNCLKRYKEVQFASIEQAHPYAGFAEFFFFSGFPENNIYILAGQISGFYR